MTLDGREGFAAFLLRLRGKGMPALRGGGAGDMAGFAEAKPAAAQPASQLSCAWQTARCCLPAYVPLSPSPRLIRFSVRPGSLLLPRSGPSRALRKQ